MTASKQVAALLETDNCLQMFCFSRLLAIAEICTIISRAKHLRVGDDLKSDNNDANKIFKIDGQCYT